MKYDVHVTRDGRWWMVEVPSLDLLTQARRVDEIEEQARSLIAVSLDVPQSGVEVRIAEVRIGDIDALAVAEQVKALRAEAAEAERRASEAAREAVAELVRDDAPVRDIGALLGISHQRVSQLAGVVAEVR